MAGEEHFRKLERLYAGAPINEFFRPRLIVSDGEASLTMDVVPAFLHAGGAVHGSVYFKALDDAAWFAVASRIDDDLVLTASFNVYLVRPIDSGELRAHGRVVHGSRRLWVAESTLTDARGRLLGRGSGTFMRAGIPLDERVGYR